MRSMLLMRHEVEINKKNVMVGLEELQKTAPPFFCILDLEFKEMCVVLYSIPPYLLR